jgi:hypothetical protein
VRVAERRVPNGALSEFGRHPRKISPNGR